MHFQTLKNALLSTLSIRLNEKKLMKITFLKFWKMPGNLASIK